MAQIIIFFIFTLLSIIALIGIILLSVYYVIASLMKNESKHFTRIQKWLKFLYDDDI